MERDEDGFWRLQTLGIQPGSEFVVCMLDASSHTRILPDKYAWGHSGLKDSALDLRMYSDFDQDLDAWRGQPV